MFKFFKKLISSSYFYLGILLIASLGHLVFSIRINNFFSVDDFATLAYFKSHTVFQMIPDFLVHGDIFMFRRLIGFIAFGGIFKIFGANHFAFDISMFFIHLICVYLIFFISFNLSKNLIASFFAALIFNKNYLFYYSNIHETLLGLFCFLTIYLFLNYPKKFYLSFIAFFLALFTKETAATLPFFLLALSLVYKRLNRKNILYLFLMSVVMGTYYLYFFITEKVKIPNFSYTSSFSLKDIWNGIVFFLGYPVVFLLTIWPIVIKKYKYLLILASVLIALLPASMLINRRELYYVYMPYGYLMLYLSLLLPKFNIKSLLIYVFAFLIFGGRTILPKIAWQIFPNWQKVSIEKVTNRINSTLAVNKNPGLIDIADINLERDARLMLQSGTTDLFVNKSVGEKYDFQFNEEESKIIITPKTLK